jgi:SAM-dependent methyltransferase
MDWNLAQELEGKYWDSMARGMANPSDLLPELSQLAVSMSYIINEHKRIVEIGVGPMTIGSAVFQFPDSEILGVDPLEPIQFTCHHQHLHDYITWLRSKVTYVKSMGEKMPFEDSSFDVVVSHNCIDHCQSALDILKEGFRVLKPGGTFLLSLNTFSWLGQTKFELMRRLQPSKPLYVQHPWTFRHSQVMGHLHDLGLRIVKHRGAGDDLFGRFRVSFFQCLK